MANNRCEAGTCQVAGHCAACNYQVIYDYQANYLHSSEAISNIFRNFIQNNLGCAKVQVQVLFGQNSLKSITVEKNKRSKVR